MQDIYIYIFLIYIPFCSANLYISHRNTEHGILKLAKIILQ